MPHVDHTAAQFMIMTQIVMAGMHTRDDMWLPLEHLEEQLCMRLLDDDAAYHQHRVGAPSI